MPHTVLGIIPTPLDHDVFPPLLSSQRMSVHANTVPSSPSRTRFTALRAARSGDALDWEARASARLGAIRTASSDIWGCTRSVLEEAGGGSGSRASRLRVIRAGSPAPAWADCRARGSGGWEGGSLLPQGGQSPHFFPPHLLGGCPTPTLTPRHS